VVKRFPRESGASGFRRDEGHQTPGVDCGISETTDDVCERMVKIYGNIFRKFLSAGGGEELFGFWGRLSGKRRVFRFAGFKDGSLIGM